MGGRGSGRPAGYGRENTTENSLPLDIRHLQRRGVLVPGQTCSWQWTLGDRVRASIQIRALAWQVELTYNYAPRGGPAEVIHQTVMLETTPCTLGGRRTWFRCSTCCARVAVIYGAGRLFGCRTCQGVPYASQRETNDDRATRHADRIRKKLGWVAGILNEPGVKPKGMHWRTYERLLAQHDHFVSVSLVGMARKLGLLRGQLEDIGAAAASWR